MLAYQVRIALKSLRRTPVLSALLVAGIALGVAVATTFVTTYATVAGNPVPTKSDRLFAVQLDAWSPQRPWDDDEPEEPPDQLTWRDATALLASDIPTYHTAMHKAGLMVHPGGEGQRPFRALTRMTRGDFFPMFDAPFLYGGGWDRAADERPEAVAVLDEATNRRLFGGEDSVGRSVRIEDRDFTVVGVLAPWWPKPKYFDPLNDPFERPEEVYLPLGWTPLMEIQSAGNSSGWKYLEGDAFADLLASEQLWLQYWVQLDSPEQRQAYAAFLDAYALEQKKLGRFGRPLNNRLRDVMAWLAVREVVPDASRTMLVIGLLFLVVSAVNLIGILLGKFLARAPEVGVRRALGASRGAIFLQHLVECQLVGVLGGALGLLLAVGVVGAVDRLFRGAEEAGLFALDLPMLAAGLLLALVAGLIAGVYPAWRICRVPPANYLKQQ